MGKVLNPAVKRRYEEQLAQAQKIGDRAAVLVLQSKLEADEAARRNN